MVLCRKGSCIGIKRNRIGIINELGALSQPNRHQVHKCMELKLNSFIRGIHIFDAEKNRHPFFSIGHKLESFDFQARFFDQKLVLIGKGIIGERFSLVETKSVVSKAYRSRKSIHQFDGMQPDSPHLSLHMPAHVLKGSILVAN